MTKDREEKLNEVTPIPEVQLITQKDKEEASSTEKQQEEKEEVETQEDKIVKEDLLKHNQNIIKQIPNKSNQLMTKDREKKLDEATPISEAQLITQKDKEETSSTEKQQEEKPEVPSTEKQQEEKEDAQPDKQISTLQMTKTLPETGEQSQYLIFTAATLAILASVGLYSTSKNETDY